MEIEIKQKNIPISPKKARLFVISLKGKKIEETLKVLKFSRKKAAYYFKKLLENGMVAVANKNLDKEKIYIKSLKVDKAPYLKRIRYRPRGRADLITRARSHLGIILAEAEDVKEAKSKSKQATPKLKEKKHGSKS